MSFGATGFREPAGPAVPFGDLQLAAATMERLAMIRPGCLGLESARDSEGFGQRWGENDELRVARVERAYGWDLTEDGAP